MMPYDLSVIVILHNQGSRIEECDDELTAILPTLGLRVELIYVDSGSTDDTVFRLSQRLKQPPAANTLTKKLILLRRNFGMTAAFTAGADHSQGRFIATIDAKLTVDPLEIARLVDEIEKGYDLVSGWRQRQHLGRLPRMRSTLVNRITSRVTGLRLLDYGSTFRIFRRDFLPDLRAPRELYQFLPVFAYRAGARITEIPVAYRPQYYTGWEYTPMSVWNSFLDLITVWFLSRHALRPMYIFGTLGFSFIAAAFVVITIAFINRNATGVSLIQTPLPTLAGILLAVGIQTVFLGFTTELVLRTYYEAQGHPTYSVRDIITQ